jgi:hypothetical protein
MDSSELSLFHFDRLNLPDEKERFQNEKDILQRIEA